jgi:putative ABC transport system ATP-binding protein
VSTDTTGTTPAVRCTAVTRTHPGGAQALRGVDLVVAPGEMVAVMGASGSGKSTLLQLLGGLDTPTSGTVEVAGQQIGSLSEAKRAVLRRRHIGYVFQAFNLVPNLSVADNVEMPLLLAGVGAGSARKRRTELLERLGLAEHAAKAPGALSGGQQQRVALARALANRPDVLLADEPTGALDTAAAADVMALLREHHREGQTVVLVTHDHRIAATADRVVTLRDGLVVDEADLAALATVDDVAPTLSGLLTLGDPFGPVRSGHLA